MLKHFEHVLHLLLKMKCLQEVTGLKINMNKTKIYGVGYEEVDRIARGRAGPKFLNNPYENYKWVLLNAF